MDKHTPVLGPLSLYERQIRDESLGETIAELVYVAGDSTEDVHARGRQIVDLYSQLATVTEQLTEERARVERLRSAISARDEYINLLIEELNSAVPMAVIHGWASLNVEKGNAARMKIKEADEALAATSPSEPATNLRAIIADLIASVPDSDDPRLDYVELEVDRRTLQEAREALRRRS